MSTFRGVKKEYEVACVAEFAKPIGKVKFFATFKKLKRSELVGLQHSSIVEMLDRLTPESSDKMLDIVDQFSNLERQEELMITVKENLVGWRDMHGETDEDADLGVGEEADDLVPFNEETKEEALEIIEYALALSRGFMQVQVGNLQLQAKNL